MPEGSRLVCYCYRVSLRKLVNFARRERPRRASQMSQCLDAGTGCGWCIPILKRIHADPDAFDDSILDPESYAKARDDYRKAPENKNEF
ncbi:MAG: (2Fe-2S)-binding protein [Planctomycetota bacterium]|jgi:NAD(P)H-nitrite reductase large subunit